MGPQGGVGMCAGCGWGVCRVRPCRVVLCWMQGEAVQGCAVLDAGWVHRVGSVCVQGVGGVQSKIMCLDLPPTTTLLDLAMTTKPLSGHQLYYS